MFEHRLEMSIAAVARKCFASIFLFRPSVAAEGVESFHTPCAILRDRGEASVIGSGMHDLALSPRDPDVLIVANDYGVWRSADGGLSWTGLNQALPNLPVSRILSTPQGLSGTRIAAAVAGLLELQPGADNQWRPIADPQLSAQLDRDAAQRQSASQKLGAEIRAAAGAGEILYAGAANNPSVKTSYNTFGSTS